MIFVTFKKIDGFDIDEYRKCIYQTFSNTRAYKTKAFFDFSENEVISFFVEMYNYEKVDFNKLKGFIDKTLFLTNYEIKESIHYAKNIVDWIEKCEYIDNDSENIANIMTNNVLNFYFFEKENSRRLNYTEYFSSKLSKEIIDDITFLANKHNVNIHITEIEPDEDGEYVDDFNFAYIFNFN